MIGSMSLKSRKSSMSFRSCVALSRLRPKRMYDPGCTRRNNRAVSASSSFPGTPVIISCPSESAFMARKDERSTRLQQACGAAGATFNVQHKTHKASPCQISEEIRNRGNSFNSLANSQKGQSVCSFFFLRERGVVVVNEISVTLWSIVIVCDLRVQIARCG